MRSNTTFFMNDSNKKALIRIILIRFREKTPPPRNLLVLRASEMSSSKKTMISGLLRRHNWKSNKLKKETEFLGQLKWPTDSASFFYTKNQKERKLSMLKIVIGIKKNDISKSTWKWLLKVFVCIWRVDLQIKLLYNQFSEISEEWWYGTKSRTKN